MTTCRQAGRPLHTRAGWPAQQPHTNKSPCEVCRCGPGQAVSVPTRMIHSHWRAPVSNQTGQPPTRTVPPTHPHTTSLQCALAQQQSLCMHCCACAHAHAEYGPLHTPPAYDHYPQNARARCFAGARNMPTHATQIPPCRIQVLEMQARQPVVHGAIALSTCQEVSGSCAAAADCLQLPLRAHAGHARDSRHHRCATSSNAPHFFCPARCVPDLIMACRHTTHARGVWPLDWQGCWARSCVKTACSRAQRQASLIPTSKLLNAATGSSDTPSGGRCVGSTPNLLLWPCPPNPSILL